MDGAREKEWRKTKKLTPNIQHTLRNQRRKFTNFLINIIPPSSFNNIMALPPPSSFLICQQGLLVTYRLMSLLLRFLLTPLSSVSPRVCCGRTRNMGRRGELALLSLILGG